MRVIQYGNYYNSYVYTHTTARIEAFEVKTCTYSNVSTTSKWVCVEIDRDNCNALKVANGAGCFMIISLVLMLAVAGLAPAAAFVETPIVRALAAPLASLTLICNIIGMSCAFAVYKVTCPDGGSDVEDWPNAARGGSPTWFTLAFVLVLVGTICSWVMLPMLKKDESAPAPGPTRLPAATEPANNEPAHPA